METLLRYFPDLTAAQRERFAVLDEAYRTWNERINVISRKDIDRLYPHHVLHSLAIAKVCALRPGARVMDVGCGGGFPGIPLPYSSRRRGSRWSTRSARKYASSTR